MPTIIDSLVVKLGLNTQGFAASGTAATNQLNKLQSASKATTVSFENMARSVGTFLAALGGTYALKVFIEDTIASSAALDRLSKNLGVSVENISAWSNAVEELGGNAKGLQGTLSMLSQSQTDLQLTGQSNLIPYFAALGVAMTDIAGKARPVDDILVDLADRFSHLDRPTANNLGKMMGIDQDTLNLLLQGRHEVELTIKRQKEHNAVSKAQAEQAAKLQKSIVEVKQSFEAFGRGLLEQATPALEKLLDHLINFGNWVNANQSGILTFLKAFGATLAIIGLSVLPIDLAVVGVIALAAAIGLLWQDYQTWKNGGKSLINWGNWKKEIDEAKKGIDGLIKTLEVLKDTVEIIWKGLHGDTKGANTLSEKLRTRVMQSLGLNPNSSPIPDSFRNLFRSKDNQIQISAAPTTPKDEADRVSKLTGIPADLLLAQWKHETGNFTNRGAKELNNLAGINVPGGKGEDYRKFKSLDDFGDYYASLINRKYPDAGKAKTADDLATALKNGGYYSDSEQNYASGISRYLTGARGASSNVAAAGAGRPGSSSDDHSVSVQTGPVTINAQGSSVSGAFNDWVKSFNYGYTAQANTGLN